MTDLFSNPQLILDEQHASESFCMFECVPLKKVADVNKIFIYHKDIQFDITTFHFKNQLDSSKKPLKAKPGETLTSKYNNRLHCKDNEPSDVSYICLRN